MKRRDFNRLALGIGLSPMLSDWSLAQWYEGSSPPTQPRPLLVQPRDKRMKR